jgi:UTP--glucose-1-phosphate uridylyltransferase
MEIKKAVITCAGPAQRSLPLQTLIDREGNTNTALSIIVAEAVSAGIEDIGLVIHPGDQKAYAAAAGSHGGRITWLEQPEPRGYGHAVLCAREFTDGKPFLLMVGDHLYVSGRRESCAKQLIDIAMTGECAVSAVQATHESKLPFYGAIGGRLAGGRPGLFEVDQVMEKPTPTQAEQQLIVPGMRAGHYLCFFGLHVLTPTLMEALAAQLDQDPTSRSTGLSGVLNSLAARERYLAAELDGRRYDIGERFGLLTAQLAIAFSGKDRDEVLARLEVASRLSGLSLNVGASLATSAWKQSRLD